MAVQDPQQRPVARRADHGYERYAQHEDHRRGWPKWPLWLLLGLFALACLVAGLISANNDDDGDRGARSQSQSQSQNAGSAGGTAGDGRLTAGGAGIVPGQTGGLRDHVGQPAEGQNLTVQSVSGKSGFFAGTSPQDRVYVEWSSAVGENEADFVPKPGERVNLRGEVRPAPANPAQTLKLQPEAAEVVRSQGAFVNAQGVSRAG
jgi:hypothetical protein